MPTAERNDPYHHHNFRIEIDGLTVGAFSEVSGLVSDGDAADYREGTDKVNSVRKLPGLRKYTNIVLKRGYTQNKELWAWWRNIANGQQDRRNGAIILMDEARNDVLRWSFVSAWPNKIEGPSLNAATNEVAMESMELIHEGLDIEI
ncbi:phage tail protein [Falsiroseomonas sp. E2-1-a4]|uniref:phage tail protein n=1 Tax=Falsiroseomonas sp. E2-1-a4 TaxID=3239299 RepID=UPI003F2E21F9